MLERDLSDGVALRWLEERDADELYELIDADRDHLAPWLPWAAAETRADALGFIRSTRRQLADDNGLQTALTVDGRIAGVVGVHGISRADGSTSVGYWLAEAHQGRGAMTAAVRAYTDHAFKDWRLNRVELRAAVGNDRSRALAERLGFKPEGVLRQAERVGDRFVDLAVYSVLAAEWNG